MQIRPYQPGDLPDLRALLQEVLEDGSTYVYTDLDAFQASWLAPECHVFVAEEEGRQLGSYGLKPNATGRGDHVANAFFAVGSAARGRRAGLRMGQHALEEARRLGFQAMQFNMVVSTNEGAIALWKKLGFAEVGRLPRVFRHPAQGLVDALVMWREL